MWYYYKNLITSRYNILYSHIKSLSPRRFPSAGQKTFLKLFIFMPVMPHQ